MTPSASPRPTTITGFLLDAARRRAAEGDRRGAAVLAEEASRADPADAGAARLLAELLLPADPGRAAEIARRLTAVQHDDPALFGLLARALAAAGRAGDAVRAFETAASLAPADGLAHANLAVARLRAGDPHGARRAAEEAVARSPERAETHASLGHVATFLHDTDAALIAFQAALARDPAAVDSLVGLARAWREAGRPSTAIAALQRAAALAPGAADPHVELATLYRETGDPAAAADAHRTALALAPPLSYFESNVLLAGHYDPDLTAADAAAAAWDWGLRLTASVPATTRPSPDRTATTRPSADRDRARPLRVGYVSADLYRHPVGWLGARAIAGHDPAAVTAFVYANQTATDALTESLRAGVAGWLPILGLDDATVAARIAADRIDVLVDLSGHTAGNRLGVFARRPAPVQVSWLGYVGTSGLPTMDFVLLDRDHVVVGTDAWFTEGIVTLPDCRFCYTPPDDSPEPGPPPSSRAGHVTFGSFNNTAKLNDRVLALWGRVLDAVPGSTLLLKWRSLADPSLQERLRAAFGRGGIAPDRIRFEGHEPHAAMLRRYDAVDVALDPFPFCGGLTTAEAMWMGVPVVTLPGRRVASRQSHALTRAAGFAGWSATSEEDYVARASDLARDEAGRAALRRSARATMRASALCDLPRFSRALEATLRQCWDAFAARA